MTRLSRHEVIAASANRAEPPTPAHPVLVFIVDVTDPPPDDHAA